MARMTLLSGSVRKELMTGCKETKLLSQSNESGTTEPFLKTQYPFMPFSPQILYAVAFQESFIFFWR